MKKSLILLLGFFLFVLFTGCIKDESQLKQGEDNVPTTNVADNEPNSSDPDNAQVTERANCGCTITAISPTTASVSICGVTTGFTVCMDRTCPSTIAGYLVNYTPSPVSGFNIQVNEPFRVTNTDTKTIQVNIDCGNLPTGGITVTLTPGQFYEIDTDNHCNIAGC